MKPPGPAAAAAAILTYALGIGANVAIFSVAWPRVYAAVAAFVSLVAMLAAWPPARRAARVEPMRALKD